MGRLHQNNGGRMVSPAVAAISSGFEGNLTGGSLWFSPGFFGVDPTSEYLLSQGSYTHVRYRRTQATSYGWWVLFVTKSSNTYTVTFGARISVSAGTVGEVLELAFDDAEETIGSATVTTSDTYLAWISSAPTVEAGPTSIHYWDTQAASYLPTSSAPTVGTSYTPSNVSGQSIGSGGNPRFNVYNDVPNVYGGVWQLGSKQLIIPALIVAAGGTTATAIVSGISYKFHTFTSTSDLVVTTGGNMDILLVGGGGGGGTNSGGGGGGGAIIVASGFVGPGTYTATVGNGGAGGTLATNTYNAGQGDTGADTTFAGITATGGGGGGAYNALSGRNGANGGGGGGYTGSGGTGTSPTIPSGFTGTVYAGSDGRNAGGSTLQSGGGGGAAGTTKTGNDGDDGISITFEGNIVYYAGGGGSGAWQGSAGGDGGLGGGGGGGSKGGGAGSGGAGRNAGSNGGNAQDTNGGDAGANTGGGGGGSTFYGSGGAVGGAGGSGIVIVRYRN